MVLYLIQIGKWLLGKSAVIIIATFVAIGVYALYLYIGDSYRVEKQRLAQLAEAQEAARAAYGQLESMHGSILAVTVELESAREKLLAANELVGRLEGFLSIFEYLLSSTEEKRAIDRELAEAKSESARLEPLINELRKRMADLRVSRTDLTSEVEALENRISALESSSSEVARYVDASWTIISRYLPMATVLFLLGPVILKLAAYYAIAPLFQRVRPIRFSEDSLPSPAIQDSGVSMTLGLKEGEKAWIKESYLQASDEQLDRRTRFVLNWQIPVTCLAAGLIELVEFASNENSSNGSITASTQDKPDMELSLLEVPPKSSIILRPSHLVALIGSQEQPLAIRRRWSFSRAQAWMMLQFRYFEFLGPCRLVVSGVRGIRAEKIESVANGGRRANQDSTIGFTPDLNFAAVRAETFWAYFRGFNPLFDDVFKGEGTFLCQEISKSQEPGTARFWAGMRDAFLKVIGI